MDGVEAGQVRRVGQVSVVGRVGQVWQTVLKVVWGRPDTAE